MTKKDYELIASAIEHELYGNRAHSEPNHAAECAITALICLANEIAERLEAQNPRFDRDRFLLACGVTA